MTSRFPAQGPVHPELPSENSPVVLIAYENLRAAQHAFKIIQRAFANAEASADFRPILWSFERLNESASRTEAAADASQADILVVAASGGAPFSPELKQWLSACLHQKRGQSAAIVTLVPPPEPGASAGAAMIEFIRLVAEQAGLDFFASHTERFTLKSTSMHSDSVGGQ